MGQRLFLATIVVCSGYWIAGCGSPDNTVEGGVGDDTGIPEGDGSVRDAGADAAHDAGVHDASTGDANLGPDGNAVLDGDTFADAGDTGLGDGSTGSGDAGDGSTGDAGDSSLGGGDGSTGTTDASTGSRDGSTHVDFDAETGSSSGPDASSVYDVGLISADQDSSLFISDTEVVGRLDAVF